MDMIFAADIFEGIFHQRKEKQGIDLLTIEPWIKPGLEPELFRTAGLLQPDKIFEIMESPG